MGVKENIKSNKDEVPGSDGRKKDNNKPEERRPPTSPVKRTGLHDFFALVVGYGIILVGLYGVVSFTAPTLFNVLQANISGTLCIILFGFAVFGTIVKTVERIVGSSFVAIDRKARKESNVSAGSFNKLTISSFAKGVIDRLGLPLTLDSTEINDTLELVKEEIKEASAEYKAVERERVLGTAFEVYVCSVVESLDKHISLTEEKGSNLLDRGLLFLFGGILYYVVAIVAWQAWAKIGQPSDTVMYIGMVASSVVFLVCEFLAAWFLKQYRHYMDASLACLRVKSVYDRYMLSYYAVKEMVPEGGEVSEKLNRVLEVIKEDVMWPGHKENMNNDFNYMIESMNSVHASLDKFKGLFDSKPKPAAGDGPSDGK
ncbi:hypothetical protein ACIPQ1_09110 [Pseudomonas sp. LARHCG127]|uniref:hypothetical protein n=1 Tax=unclassified Pseudomonas TaxID=196821 RepID=UPI003984EF60